MWQLSEGRVILYSNYVLVGKISVDGVPAGDEKKSCYSWLEERERPEDLTVVGALYSGPKIVGK